MTYDELRRRVLDIHDVSLDDDAVDCGETFKLLYRLSVDLRCEARADGSALVATESGPVDLAPMRLEARDPLFDLWNSLPAGYTLTVARNISD